MPNWCMNELTVSGDAEELKRFVFATQGLPANTHPRNGKNLFHGKNQKMPSFVLMR